MRPRIDCTHPRARHQHGTRNAYVLDKCRCDDCTRASTEYSAHLRRQQAYGRSSLVDAEPVRRHIRRLGEQGMGWMRVARAAGVAVSVVGGILYGSPNRSPRIRIRQSTHDRILAVTYTVAPGGLVPSVGTRRRLQALVAVGWSMNRLGGLLSNVNMHDLMRQTAVQARTAERVARLYDDIWDQKPPHAQHRDLIAYNRSINYARSRGWLPPLAWDDDSIDNPDAGPSVDSESPADVEMVDEVLIQRALDGVKVKASKTERLIITERWRASGRPITQLDRIQSWNTHRDRRAA